MQELARFVDAGVPTLSEVSDRAAGVPSAVESLFDGNIGDGVSGLAEIPTEATASAVGSLASLATFATAAVQGAGSVVVNTTEGVVGGVKKFADAAVDTVTSAGQAAARFVRSLF